MYSTTVNTYNARDQLKQIRQYAGTEGSGTFQDTTMTYDGHGRLKTRHLPEQQVDPNNSASTDHTTWEIYNPDDTIQKVTDARGASQTFTYNNRHLVSSVTYSWPNGGTVPGPVTLSYDAAGNRISMTDGFGSVGYGYDQHSRLATETRTINGVGTFAFAYGYNLANQLTSIVDPFGSLSYNFDTAHRLGSITGTGYGSIPPFTSNIRYRAWGAVKSLNFGDGRSGSNLYNDRLQISRFEVSGLMSTEYEYASPGQNDNDGRVKYVRNLSSTNSPFDRRFRYDQVGRMVEALTGADARAGLQVSNDSPFYQTYQYDALSHLTGRDGRAWSEPAASFSNHVYTNNRNGLWTYDADGNPLSQTSLQNTYNAAGQVTQVVSGPRERFPNGVTVAKGHDGNGQRIRHQENTSAPIYYLRSSALGGAVVAELNQSGQRLRGYVYAGGEMLAKYENTIVEWQHQNPITGSQRWTRVNGGLASFHSITELDPMGVDAGFIDWAEFQQEQQMGAEMTAPRYGDAHNLGTGCMGAGAPEACGGGSLHEILYGGREGRSSSDLGRG
ncbi:MAG: hypothetical protein ACRD8U_22535, partial [Pyrinomonadaceae bacterium]